MVGLAGVSWYAQNYSPFRAAINVCVSAKVVKSYYTELTCAGQICDKLIPGGIEMLKTRTPRR